MNDIEKNIKIFKRISSIKDIDWQRVSIKSRLPEQFIHDNAYFLDWYSISKYQKMSYQFIDSHYKNVVWSLIAKKYVLPDDIINRHYKLFDEATKSILNERVKNESSD